MRPHEAAKGVGEADRPDGLEGDREHRSLAVMKCAFAYMRQTVTLETWPRKRFAHGSCKWGFVEERSQGIG